MKKCLCLLLLFLLLTGIAYPEAPAERLFSSRGLTLTLNRRTNTITGTDRNGVLSLLSPDGHKLAEESFAFIEEDPDHAFLRVVPLGEDSLFTGLMDAEGWVIPPEYDAVNILSDRWTVGIRMRVAGETESVEYTVGDVNCVTDHADLYYRGRRVTILHTGEYYGRYGAYDRAAGDYAAIIGAGAEGFWFNRDGQVSALIREDRDLQEWDGIFHCPTGLEGFDFGCKLSEDEVDLALFYDDRTHEVVTLNGEVLFSVDPVIASNFTFRGFEGNRFPVFVSEDEQTLCVFTPAGESCFIRANDSVRYGENRSWISGDACKWAPPGSFVSNVRLAGLNEEEVTFISDAGIVTATVKQVSGKNPLYPGFGIAFRNSELNISVGSERKYDHYRLCLPDANQLDVTGGLPENLTYAADAIAFLTESGDVCSRNGTLILSEIENLSFDGSVALGKNQVYRIAPVQ